MALMNPFGSGATGAAGARGTNWYTYSGAGTPTGLTGMLSGDLCVRQSDGEVFKYNGTAWVDQSFALAAATVANWNATILPYMAYTIGQGTWGLGASTSRLFAFDLENSSKVVNDSISWGVDLSAGTWTFNGMGVTNSDGGTATLYIDGTSFGTWDFYSAGSANNSIKNITGISVAASGHHTFTMTATTKNASSTSYCLRVNLFTFTRTA